MVAVEKWMVIEIGMVGCCVLFARTPALTQSTLARPRRTEFSGHRTTTQISQTRQTQIHNANRQSCMIVFTVTVLHVVEVCSDAQLLEYPSSCACSFGMLIHISTFSAAQTKCSSTSFMPVLRSFCNGMCLSKAQEVTVFASEADPARGRQHCYSY